MIENSDKSWNPVASAQVHYYHEHACVYLSNALACSCHGNKEILLSFGSGSFVLSPFCASDALEMETHDGFILHLKPRPKRKKGQKCNLTHLFYFISFALLLTYVAYYPIIDKVSLFLINTKGILIDSQTQMFYFYGISASVLLCFAISLFIIAILARHVDCETAIQIRKLFTTWNFYFITCDVLYDNM